MMSPHEKRKKLDWLQALRGIAALGVVLTHARFIFLNTPYWPVAQYIFLPFAGGVDLFFVISGFIMVYATREAGGITDAIAFARKRILRVWPAYAAISLGVLILSGNFSIWANASLYIELGKTLSFIPVDYKSIYGNQIIGQGWTLNYEMYFYFLFFTSIIFNRLRWLFFAIVISITLVIIPAYFDSSLDPVKSYATAYPIDFMKLACNPIIFEFAFGMVAGWLYFSNVRISTKAICYTLALATPIVSIFILWQIYNYTTLPMGAVFALDVAIFGLLSRTIELKVPRALSRLGDVSYTLYLVNLTIVNILRLHVFRQSFPGTISAIIGYLLTVALCVLAALLISPVVERWLPSGISAAMTAITRKRLRSA